MNAKMRKVAKFYGLSSCEEFSTLTAADIEIIRGVGAKSVGSIRVHLAERGVSLKGDNPPEYWLQAGRKTSDPSPPQYSTCPFTIVVDTNETYPFTFDGIIGSSGNPIDVRTVRVPLYRQGMADYTIEGMEQDVQVERKAEDLSESICQRRDRFEDEISRLNGMCDFAAIVIEKQWSDLLFNPDGHGMSPRSISRTWISWSIKYPVVHWFWCAGREHAEQVTFRILEKFWQIKQKADSEAKVNSMVRPMATFRE